MSGDVTKKEIVETLRDLGLCGPSPYRFYELLDEHGKAHVRAVALKMRETKAFTARILAKHSKRESEPVPHTASDFAPPEEK